MSIQTEPRFPLFQRAVDRGVLDGGGVLVVAPTATGKSHLGREVVRRAVERGDPGTHAYLVPFRALAEEVYAGFLDLLAPTNARVRISTGDHRDPLRPAEADVVVATYESFAGLTRLDGFRPGVVVADEVHLVAEERRGPVVEGLLARLLAGGRAAGLCALSAVVDNAAELAEWLGVPLLLGEQDDRVVPLEVDALVADDLDAGLRRAIGPCFSGEQAIVFCSSRAGSEAVARELADRVASCLDVDQRSRLAAVADRIRDEDPGAEERLLELLPKGVAYHHAGLPRVLRHHIEAAFRGEALRVVTATPTLAAGVNLPAGVVAVRDVFRREAVRGTYQRVLLPSGEVLNMLGRAGRPGRVERGLGVAVVEREDADDDEVKELLADIREGRGGEVRSRLPESFEAVMRFVLGVAVDGGEVSQQHVADAYRRTLAWRGEQGPIRFDRPFRDDMMEDIAAYQKVVEAKGAIGLRGYELSPSGLSATVVSSGRTYEVGISVLGLTCTCPAASRWRRNSICKHQACAIHDLLFADGVDPETRMRAIYACGHLFTKTLDVGTRLDQALGILTGWRLLERVPAGWRATPLGEVAAGTWFDLLLVHQITGRIEAAGGCRDHREVARWAVEDYFAEGAKRKRWLAAVEHWLGEVDVREFALPERYRGTFEARLDELSSVCLLYEKAADALGKEHVAAAARQAASCIRYGVAPELVPLMALGFPQLRRARCRYLYERGVRDLAGLAAADPAALADPRRAPARLVGDWVARAAEIHRARAVATADREEADEELDELVARFRIDPAALA